MSTKFVIAAIAAGFLVASCGDDSGSGGGGGGTASGGAGKDNFVKVCQTAVTKQTEKQAAAMEKIKAGMKDVFVKAIKNMCSCMGEEIAKSDKISSSDKSKIWSVKSFSPASQPKVSDASKAGFQAAVKVCQNKMKEEMKAGMK